MNDAYLIWSNEHRAWWRPARAGYTVHVDSAGRYTRDEAIRISARARNGWQPGEPPPEIPVLEADALACLWEIPAEKTIAAMHAAGRPS